MDNSLRLIVKQVTDAQNYDSLGNYKDAYIKYLQSTQSVIHQLLGSATNTQEIRCDASTKKMVNVGVMCIQRAEELLNSKIECHALSPSDSTPPAGNNMFAVLVPSSSSGPVHDAGNTVISPSGSAQKKSIDVSLNIIQSHSLSCSLSPVELAERKNRQIMAAYKQRMFGLSTHKATDMSLSLQRRLAENIAIARAREKALAKKREERRARLEAEAAKHFATTTVISEEELERRQLYTKTLNFEHENIWLLQWREKLEKAPTDSAMIEQLVSLILRTSSHPFSQLFYTYQNKISDVAQALLRQWEDSYQVLEQHQEVNGCPSRDHCQSADSSSVELFQACSIGSDHAESPPASIPDPKGDCWEESANDSGYTGTSSAESVSESRGHISDGSAECSTPEGQSQFGKDDNDKTKAARPSAEGKEMEKAISLQELNREAILHHLSNITADIQAYLEKLVTMFIVVFGCLDHATGHHCCYVSIAEHFYKPLWSPILSLFRLVYKREESQISAVMSKHKDSSPVDFQIPRKFCLLPEDSLLMPEAYQPYQSAISHLQSMAKMVSPLAKLDCLVNVSRAICRCVEEFYHNNNSDPPNIGADDLLPILSYVVAKTNVPEIFAECQALEELVHEGYLMGEEGYCLTSLETALKYVMSLN